MFKESKDKFTNKESGLNKAEALRWNDSLLHREAMQPSVCAESGGLLTLFRISQLLILGLGVHRGHSNSASFQRVCLCKITISHLMPAFPAEKAMVVVHLTLSFLLGQLAI
jgi:hypothetical protein